MGSTDLPPGFRRAQFRRDAHDFFDRVSTKALILFELLIIALVAVWAVGALGHLVLSAF